MVSPAPHKAPLSRLEVNFLRVLRETELMASGSKTANWTFEKHLRWLEHALPELETSPCPPNADTLRAHRRQLLKLRGMLQAEATLQADSGAVVVPPPTGSQEVSLSQQIQHRASARLNSSLRKQLLGDEGSEGVSGGEVEAAEVRLASDEQRRERLLSDMLLLTRQWRDQSSTASGVIRRDLATLDQSSQLASTNEAHLRTEAERLALLNKRACNCWIWMLLVLVCCVFFSMVLFIRIFPKRHVITSV